MADDLENTIRENAQGPAKAAGDSGSVEQHTAVRPSTCPRSTERPLHRKETGRPAYRCHNDLSHYDPTEDERAQKERASEPIGHCLHDFAPPLGFNKPPPTRKGSIEGRV